MTVPQSVNLDNLDRGPKASSVIFKLCFNSNSRRFVRFDNPSLVMVMDALNDIKFVMRAIILSVI
ncbi:MAG: hypothetical protein Hyperionvirus51_5 [Hyperionvirus sp.]|uniref:Uncharacterized protein n=1 Tax=Hyperionvirus sp. TaxID=2487770 RepID=A0A3G5ACD2_9VIRU|nr:MAG: hypothetical protein Hyperionvirus51_5 [Hyperionvirus sp.]